MSDCPPLWHAYHDDDIDEVRKLIASGSDTTELGWTDIFRAIMLGDTSDLKKTIDSGCNLEHRDWLERTPLVLSVFIGDTGKTAMLIEAGANINVIDRDEERYLLSYAIINDDVDMLKLLLNNGFHYEQRDPEGYTPLMIAAKHSAIKCLKALIAMGADISAENDDPDTMYIDMEDLDDEEERENRTAIRVACNPEIVATLMEAGANFNHVSKSMRAVVFGYSTLEDHTFWRKQKPKFSKKDLEKYKSVLFGKTNPELATNSYWQAMIKYRWSTGQIADAYNVDKFKHKPVWTYYRSYSAIVPLPDGRYVEIGGECFEYDSSPSNWVYNDVIVHNGKGKCDIYIYPEEVFPPGIYGAFLLDQHIVISRTFLLDINTMKIVRIETRSDKPGQVAEHEASPNGESKITSDSKDSHLAPDHRALLEWAYHQGDFNKIRQLVASGADIAELGWTDIFNAIALGDNDDLKKAIDSGCNLEHEDCLGETPLMLSILAGDTSKTAMLIDSGCDLEYRNRLGKTPLMLSATVGDTSKTAMLIEAGADTKVIDEDGRYLLSYAITKDNVDVLKLLLNNGFHHEQRDQRGNTPLMIAARHGAIKCLKALVAMGADVSAENTNPEAEIMFRRMSDNSELIDRTAMKIASNTEIVAALMEAGANFNHVRRSVRAEILGYHYLDKPIYFSKEPKFSRKDLEKYKCARYGKTNPEPATNSYWQAMVKCSWEPRTIADTYDIDTRKHNPLWTYYRDFSVGPIIPLPDGHYVEIGGAYFEFAATFGRSVYKDDKDNTVRVGKPNYYRTSNWIYNDIIVHDGKGKCDIYMYPREAFPPLYGHTATLTGQYIYIIGNSCTEDKGFLLDNYTQVLRLDIATMKIERIETSGDRPDQVGKYYASYDGKSKIVVRKMGYLYNSEEYSGHVLDYDSEQRYTLCLESMQWEKLA